MCIRDRDSAVILWEKLFVVLQNFQTVSYTHLDVYKRQDMDSAGQHQTDPACRVSGTENHLVLFDLHVAGSQTGEHLG